MRRHGKGRTVFTLMLLAGEGSAAYAAGTIGQTTLTPNSIPVNSPTSVLVTAIITDPSVIASSVNLQRQNAIQGTFSNIGTLYDDGTHGDAVAGDGLFSLQLTFTEAAPFPVTLRVSAAFKGSLVRAFSSPLSLNVAGSPPASIVFTSPANLSFVNSSPITVSGTVSDPAAAVTVNGIPAPSSGGTFAISVPLLEGNNILTASARNSQGEVSTASLQVTLDTTPPRVTIDSPFDGLSTSDASITVTGKANDLVVGTVNNQQVQVTVNGVVAQVANRSYQAVNIPLSLGENTITATAHDRAGNGATTQITIQRSTATQSQIKVVSGNNQTGPIGTQLSSPLVVGLVDASGNPMANQTVVFAVTLNNGILDSAKAIEAVTTNAQGQAQVSWTLGTRAGAGNNLVEANAAGFAGSAIFTASGLPTSAANINVDTGSQQSGVAGQALPYPFIAAVTDTGHNRLANIPVTFQIKQGGGNFSGQPTITTNTDGDGRAAAVLTLGPQDGIANNVIEATFPGNPGFPAAFTVSGHVAGDPAATRISGVVLDNSNNPVPGATVRAYQTNVPAQVSGGLPPNVSAQTDLQGQFSLQPVPVGFAKLIVDGSTVQKPGKWPNLEYELVTVAGQNNTVGLPIHLLPLDPVNQLCVSATAGGTLTLPQVPGFSLTVAAGSATFPGGSRAGCISVTPVHPDKIPMVPGFGQQPRFIVTVQPAGTLFNPPASVSIPNAEGLKPREVTEMYSFDHDLAAFVSVGTATVSDDGTVVKSDLGVGVTKAGWYCGGPPTPTGTCCTPPPCNKCGASGFVADPSQTTCPASDLCHSGGICMGTANAPAVCKQLKVPPTFGLIAPAGDGSDPGSLLYEIKLDPPGMRLQCGNQSSVGLYSGDTLRETVIFSENECFPDLLNKAIVKQTTLDGNGYSDQIGFRSKPPSFTCHAMATQVLEWSDTDTNNFVTIASGNKITIDSIVVGSTSTITTKLNGVPQTRIVQVP